MPAPTGPAPLRVTLDLVDLLHARAETERAELARELHDNLGGAMVAAMMDISWVQQHHKSPDVDERLTRINETLRSAVDLKRKLVERLRPSLLADMGLFTALSWLLRSMCRRVDAEYAEDYSCYEPLLEETRAMAVYRIAQEAIEIFLAHAERELLVFAISGEADELVLRLGMENERAQENAAADRAGALFESIQHRTRRLGGVVNLDPVDSRLEFTLRVPTCPAP